MNITTVKQSEQWLLEGINALLPQLSPAADALTIGQLDRIAASRCSRLYVAVEAGQVLGMLTLTIFAIPTGMRAWIEDLVVDGTARGRGVARQMIERALTHARTRGIDNINLTANPGRIAANALYRKMGFEIRTTNTYRYTVCRISDTNISKENMP